MIKGADEFIWEEVFEFQDKSGRCESAVWRTVMPHDADVHALGCDKQKSDRARGKASATYRGYIDSTAGRVRAKATTNGHRVDVVHAPAEGDWHLHVQVVLAPGTTKLGKADKSDVRGLMSEAFDALVPHDCP